MGLDTDVIMVVILHGSAPPTFYMFFSPGNDLVWCLSCITLKVKTIYLQTETQKNPVEASQILKVNQQWESGLDIVKFAELAFHGNKSLSYSG